MLLRTVRFEDGRGRRSTLKERRLVSMGDMHLGALELTLTAENWSGHASRSVRRSTAASSTRGRSSIANSTSKHLEPLAGEVVGEDGVYLLVRTCQSNIHVAQAARTRAFVDGQPREGARRVIDEPGYVGQELVDRPPARRDADTGEARLASIPRGIRPSPSAGWRRARRSRARDASRR